MTADTIQKGGFHLLSAVPDVKFKTSVIKSVFAGESSRGLRFSSLHSPLYFRAKSGW